MASLGRSIQPVRGLLVGVVLALALTGIPAAAPPTGLAQGVGVTGLHVVGNEIRNGAGQPVRLRGVDLPSAEYGCIQGWGIFNHRASGVSDAAVVQALLSWKISAVRLPLNEDCWLGINQGGLPDASFGPNYRAAIVAFASQLTQAGIAVILDLHWAAPGPVQAMYQIPMADRDHALDFWTSVATTFKSNTGVVLDLFNEPYPDDNAEDTTEAWQCLRDGSPPAGPTAHCPGPYFDDLGNPIPSNYAAAGMQELLNVVRAAGATNLVMVGGIGYAGSLKRWLTYRPVDPLVPANLAASVHIYPQGSWCRDVACWDTYLAPVAASYPLVTGEIGQVGCAHDLIDGVIDWMEGKGQHYLAWAWWTEPCGAYGLITDYGTGAATAGYGQGYHDRLAGLAPPPPPPGATATPTATGVASPTGTPAAPATPTRTATATPAATLTPTATAGSSAGSGGRSLGISSGPAGVQLTWQPGATQTGYAVGRLAGGNLTFPLALLGPTATSFPDGTPPAGIDCYFLLVSTPSAQQLSDLLCAAAGFRTLSGAPEQFTLRINQSSTASLTWDPPIGGGQDLYLLITLGGSAETASGSARSATLSMVGPTCYVLAAMQTGSVQGYTDPVCGVPGFGNLGP